MPDTGQRRGLLWLQCMCTTKTGQRLLGVAAFELPQTKIVMRPWRIRHYIQQALKILIRLFITPQPRFNKSKLMQGIKIGWHRADGRAISVSCSWKIARRLEHVAQREPCVRSSLIQRYRRTTGSLRLIMSLLAGEHACKRKVCGVQLRRKMYSELIAIECVFVGASSCI